MQVDYWKARTSYLEYRELVNSGRGTKQDDELRRAYREISRGAKVIDINQAIGGAGLDLDSGLPKLAIARADWSFVHSYFMDGRFVFAAGSRRWSTRGDRQVLSHNVAVRMTPLAGRADAAGKAQVPMIPPVHRPTGPHSAYRILFEAVWVREPPVDPILLRGIGGPFYVVLAQWDLSPLEQAVLRAQL